MIYTDGKTGVSYAKRFNVTGVTRDKEYNLTKGTERSKVHYLTANPNGEAEKVRILLSPTCSARKKDLEFYFEELEIKGRNTMGNQVTKYPVKSVKFLEAGVATLSAKKLWFDNKFGKLNTEQNGEYLGAFREEDNLLVVYSDGQYEVTNQELNQRFDPDKVLLIEKFDPEKIITAVYLDNDKMQYLIKRFKIETTTLKSKFMFIKEGEDNYVEMITTEPEPVLKVSKGRGSQVSSAKYKVAKIAEVMGWKAVGAKLVDYSKSVEMEWDMKKKKEEQPELFD
jgi:topoisomerase-4 subunit A